MSLARLILVGLITFLSLITAGHALLNKRDPRAAFGWIAVCLLFPVAGPLLYFFFGINRVQRRAQQLRKAVPGTGERETGQSPEIPSEQLGAKLAGIARTAHQLSGLPLVAGNRVEMLHNGEQVYPAMLAAIDSAQRTLFLATYIFETNTTGQQFIDALARATERGVDVRVLVDGVGELYSWPRASRELARHGIRVARSLPPRLFPPSVAINLRNHRKVLVADGQVAFTGGMNIGDRHLAERLDNPHRVADVQFRLVGPVANQLEEVFLQDWAMVTNEDSLPPPVPAVMAGSTFCRSVADGPDDEWEQLAMLLVAAISQAQQRVWVMTPYFVPPAEVIMALQNAALRGIEVSVVLPGYNNLVFVDWACRHILPQLLEWGVEVLYQPAPFVHSKLLVIDDHYAQVGSANIDARSLRLNFELVLEVYDRAAVAVIAEHIEAARRRSEAVSLERLRGGSLPIRLRDGLSWLLSPYI